MSHQCTGKPKTIRQLAEERAKAAAAAGVRVEGTVAILFNDGSEYRAPNPRNTRWQEDQIVTSLINEVAEQPMEIPVLKEYPEDVDVPIYRPDSRSIPPPLTPEQERFYVLKTGRCVTPRNSPVIIMIDEQGRKVKG